MPGNVASAVPVGVMPWSLASQYTEELRLEALVNAYPDGSSERTALALNPRRFFKLAFPLRPAKFTEMWNFYRANYGKPFWFYNLRETVPPFTYDPTGSNPVGRYAVVFDGAWSEEIQLGRSTASFNLREVA